ncbi:MAG: tyrosine-type recombinase/integrase [Acidobacteriota bacterium]
MISLPRIGDHDDRTERSPWPECALRHEGGSRLLEAGWPAHHVQHMLGHASLQQTSTYLNATLRGLHESMRTLEQSRAACKSVASTPTRSPRPTRKQAPASDGNSFIH